MAVAHCLNSRKLDSHATLLEDQKSRFDQMQTDDVKLREDLKHTKNKTKKLQKQVEAETQKVKNLKTIFEWFK